MAGELYAFDDGALVAFGDGALKSDCPEGCCDDPPDCVVTCCNTGENKGNCCRVASLCDSVYDEFATDLSNIAPYRGTWSLDAGRLKSTFATGQVGAALCRRIASTDAKITVTVNGTLTSNDGPQIGFLLEDGTEITCDISNGTFRIESFTPGSTIEDATAVTFNDATDYVMTLQKVGGAITATFDGGNTLTVTDAAFDKQIVAAALAGWELGDVGYWDDLCVEDLSTSVGKCETDCCWGVVTNLDTDGSPITVPAAIVDDTLGGDSHSIGKVCSPTETSGTTTFLSTFQIGNCNLETLKINARFQVRDDVTEIRVNGVVTGDTGNTNRPGDVTWHTLQLLLADGIQAGVNTIEVDVDPGVGADGPELRFEWTGKEGG